MVGLRRVRVVFVLGLIGGALAGCGGDPADASGTRLSRAYDKLVDAVADCAEELLDCGDQQTDRERCREAYRGCQARVSDEADPPLRAAIDACVDADQVCRDGADDAGPFSCSQELRRCVGEPGAPQGRVEPPRFDNVDPHAPTSQCFGQLRECVASDRASSGCSAQVRDCVIVAIGRLERPQARTSSARDAGMAPVGSADASTSPPRTRPSAPAKSQPKDAGSGQADRDAGGSKPECEAGYDACIAAGGERPVCDRARDACEG